MTVPYLPLARWNQLWEYQDSRVRCRTCRMYQLDNEIRKPFVHALDCLSRSMVHQYPLKDLQRIFQDKVALGLQG